MPRRPRYLSIGQAAKEYGLSRRALYDAIHRDEIEVFVPRDHERGWKVRDVDVEAWQAANTGKLSALLQRGTA